MSGLINKVKDAVSSDKNASATTSGPHTHDSNLNRSGAGHTVEHSGIGSTSNHSTTSSPLTATAGPHSSNVANKADPRIDSDLARNHGVGAGNAHSTHAYGAHGAHGSSSTGLGSGAHGSNTTPHNSNLLNKLDPRVDTGTTGAGLHSGQATGVTGSHGSHGTADSALGSSSHSTHSTTAAHHTHGLDGSGAGSTNHGSAGLVGSGAHGTTHGSTNAGPHSSILANKADPHVDSDLGGRSTHPDHGTYQVTTATHQSPGHTSRHGGLLGKVEDLVHGGPHHTETANRLDPNVPIEHSTIGCTGHASKIGAGHGHGLSSSTAEIHGIASATAAGPHSSNIANKADPRVDSDRDGRQAYGHATGATSGHGLSRSTSGHYGPATTTPTGPHTSNKAEPRVDSDRDGRQAYGHGTSTHSGHGLSSGAGPHGSTTTAGPHSSDVANEADPHVDSDNDGSHGLASGAGAASGLHKSNILNKLDPRVDSDNDGSRLK